MSICLSVCLILRVNLNFSCVMDYQERYGSDFRLDFIDLLIYFFGVERKGDR